MGEMNRAAVVGAGTMGNGIAHVLAQNGLDVTLIDLDPAFLNRALTTIEKNLNRQRDKGRISDEDVKAALGRIATATELETAAESELVIEAVAEPLLVTWMTRSASVGVPNVPVGTEPKFELSTFSVPATAFTHQ